MFFGEIIFPNIDNTTRHPSQLYEAFLEGLVLLIIDEYNIISKNNYKTRNMFLYVFNSLWMFLE